jgi:hypothetical protein
VAISNPDDIGFSNTEDKLIQIFYNVDATGDMLIVAETYIYYATTPTDYKASEAFLFEVLDTDGSTIVSTPVKNYGDRLVSIYQTAAQVTSANLTVGTAYTVRITGNPLVFPSSTGNTANVTLNSTDYTDQSVGADSELPMLNNLRNFCIEIAENIQAYDEPATDYLMTSGGYKYLDTEKNPVYSTSSTSNTTTSEYTANTTDNVTEYSGSTSITITEYDKAASSGISGADIFLEAIPGLSGFCPILFQAGAEKMDSDAPESTGAYALTLTPLDKWGTLTSDGLTNIGLFLGINQALAGSVVLFILACALAVYVYKKTQSGVTVMLMVSAAPFIGGYLGLMPMALAFIFVIIIITLMGYYFFSRGAL